MLINGAMARVMLTWPIGKLYQAVIDARAEWTLEHLAVMNVVRYRPVRQAPSQEGGQDGLAHAGPAIP